MVLVYNTFGIFILLSGTFLNDFWMGRVLNPRCETLNVDLKQLGMRCGLVIWLLIDWMYLVERFKSTQTVEPALAFVVLCHTIYILFSVRNEVSAVNMIMYCNAGTSLVWTEWQETTKCCSLMPNSFPLDFGLPKWILTNWPMVMLGLYSFLDRDLKSTG